jgi:hypothetical protein
MTPVSKAGASVVAQRRSDMINPGPTVEALRKNIDRGRAGSKVDHPDPATATLGTDDEAAGMAPSAAAVQAAHRQEVEASPAETSESRHDAGSHIYVGIVATVIAALSAVALWLAP